MTMGPGRKAKLGVLACLVAGDLVSCHPCPEPGRMVVSGTYVVQAAGTVGLNADPTWEALEGAEVTVDRDARTATIVYELEGTTYEVRYTLSE